MGYRDQLKRLQRKGSEESKGIPIWLTLLILLSTVMGITYALRPDLFQAFLSQFSGGDVNISQDSRKFPVNATPTQSSQPAQRGIVTEEPVVRSPQRPERASREVPSAEVPRPRPRVESPTPSPVPQVTSPTPSPEIADQQKLPLPEVIFDSFKKRGAGAALFINQGVIVFYNEEGLSYQTSIQASGLLPGVYTISREYSASGAFVFAHPNLPTPVVLYSGSKPEVLPTATPSLPEGEVSESAASSTPPRSEQDSRQSPPEVLYLSLNQQAFSELERVIGITGALQVF